MHVTSRAVSEGGWGVGHAGSPGETDPEPGVSLQGPPRTVSGLEACLHFQAGVLV